LNFCAKEGGRSEQSLLQQIGCCGGFEMTRVCVIGVGRIGLPLALLLAEAGYRVVGVDSNPEIVNGIRNSAIEDVDKSKEKLLFEKHLGKNLFLTKELEKGLLESEIVFISIGTSIGPDGVPDLSNAFNLVERICRSPSNIKGKLFILKSTLPVGTTRGIASVIQQKTGLSCGSDFYLAFCPERVLGDKALVEMASLPKIIGGMNNESSEKAARIYRTIGGKIRIVDSPEVAEMVKLLDNSYRQTMFAFSNDFALLSGKYGVNAFDVIEAANFDYPRNNIPVPSSGVSGYCLTKDPIYLEQSFQDITKKRGFPSVWFMARKTNDYMPIHLVNLVRQKLEASGRILQNSRIIVCGIAYKANTDDARNSHGLEIARMLSEEGAEVLLWDPRVKSSVSGFRTVEELEEIVPTVDAIVFTVNHDEFSRLNHSNNILDIAEKMRTPIIVDGCGLFLNLIGKKGILYTGIGTET
jgi:UDP-N-acetyl-D-mannosaminuronic acid dehydrogenase